MKLSEYIEALQGCEISSLTYEGVVAVVGNVVIQDGREIDRLTTKAKAKTLFDELFEQEFGSVEAATALLRAEFA